MNLQGTIKEILDPIEFDSGFKFRELILTTNDQYPQDIRIEFIKDRVSLLDSLGIGESIDVSINIRGNEHEGKYYVKIQGWKVENLAQSEPAPRTTTEPIEDTESDDLPF